ncbi:MAG: glycosyl hydrolase [Acidobacteriota bacterium]
MRSCHLALGVALTLLGGFPAASTAQSCTVNCTSGTSVTSLPQVGYYNGYYFYGLGDENGCVVTGGPAGTQTSLYMWGNFDTSIGPPPMNMGSSGTTAPPSSAPALGIQTPFQASCVQVVNIPTAGSAGVTDGTGYVWGGIPGDVTAPHEIASWTYPSNCVDTGPAGSNTAVQLGQGTAYVQVQRQAPSGMTLDSVNPTPVLFSTGAPVNTAPATRTVQGEPLPPRVHSWASGMTWSSNASQYWQNGNQYLGLQTPAYADPLIAWYSGQAPQKGSYAVNAYIEQNPGAGPSDDDVYAPGFHLGVATPSISQGDLYSAGSGPTNYNWAGRVHHGTTPPSTLGQTDSAGLQVGLDSYGKWRETIAVFPSAPKTPWVPAYLPANASTVHQGDWDVGFLMQSGTAGTTLQLDIAQGSPFAQFTSSGNAAVTIGAAYRPGYQGTPTGSVAGGITSPQDVQVPGGTVRYQILYQQVNWMPDANAESSTSLQRSNWVSFAVMWSPAAIKAKSLTGATGPDGMTYYSLPLPTGAPSYFVVAALPSQLQNNVNPATAAPYDPTASAPWATALAPYAFNYYRGRSRMSFYVGQNIKGAATKPNLVEVHYTPNLIKRGPGAARRTVFLLQPHQYSTRFQDGRNGQMPLRTSQQQPFLSFAGSQSWTRAARNKYWMPRGQLEAYVAPGVDLSYVMPSVLPWFPGSVLASAPPQTGAPCGAFASTSFVLNDLAYALASDQSYTWFTNSPPAGTKFDLNQMNDGYGAGTSLYQAAKLLAVLYGLNQPATTPTWYTGPTLPPGPTMMTCLYDQITQVFGYYFGGPDGPSATSPTTANLCQVGVGQSPSSYVYAYYDQSPSGTAPGSSHVILYPSGTVANPGRPESYDAGAPSATTIPVDAFGIATELSDNAYTWGYHILAASLMAMVLQQDSVSATPVFTAQQQQWWNQSNYGPAIDLLIKDLAYADMATGQPIPWWVSQTSLPFPRLEFMDLWTGIAYTDAFEPTQVLGKQHNSAQEAQLSWAAIYLWGQVTGRKPLADLGAFLYTLGAYANDAYFNGTLEQRVPDLSTCATVGLPSCEYASDFTVGGTFVQRATVSSLTGGSSTDNCNYFNTATLVSGGRGLSSWQTQPASAAQITTAGGPWPFLSPAVYQTYQTYQSEDGQPPLDTLANLVLPLEPSTLSVLRDAAYMGAAASATLGQQYQPYFSQSYAAVVNLLYTALGATSVPSAVYWNPSNDCTFPPAATCSQDWSQYTCQAFLSLGTAGSGFGWFWSQLTGGTVAGGLPWQNLAIAAPGGGTCSLSSCTSQIIDDSFTVPGAATGAFVDTYVLSTYGAPQNGVYCTATSPAGVLQPSCMLLGSGAQQTGFIYNPNGVQITVQLATLSGGPVGSPVTVAPYALQSATVLASARPETAGRDTMTRP